MLEFAKMREGGREGSHWGSPASEDRGKRLCLGAHEQPGVARQDQGWPGVKLEPGELLLRAKELGNGTGPREPGSGFEQRSQSSSGKAVPSPIRNG